MSYPTQILVLLDAEQIPPVEEILAFIPHEREDRIILRYSEIGAPPVVRRGEQATPVDWDGVAGGVTVLVERARGMQPRNVIGALFITGVLPCRSSCSLGTNFLRGADLRRYSIAAKPVIGTSCPSIRHNLRRTRFLRRSHRRSAPEASPSNWRVIVFTLLSGIRKGLVPNSGKWSNVLSTTWPGSWSLRTSVPSCSTRLPLRKRPAIGEAVSPDPRKLSLQFGLAVAVGGPVTLAFLSAGDQSEHSPRAVGAEYCSPGTRSSLSCLGGERRPRSRAPRRCRWSKGGAEARAVQALEELRSTLIPEALPGVLEPHDAEVVIAAPA